ncbi:hypothetical protein HanXRQr2_Chr09g0386061 [Helianthus annuus]|uniref:Uncharacterized protein n=1 Tax=Helianthus annuus TaxID=4232 RepID=A0A9K3I6F1_HELAN|nr:hypothetical protein HanXRQr2_Chr09g0386061 [Helianthus annuus]
MLLLILIKISKVLFWTVYELRLWIIFRITVSFLVFQIRRILSILFNISFGIFNFCSLFLLRNRLGSKIYVMCLWPYFIRNQDF